MCAMGGRIGQAQLQKAGNTAAWKVQKLHPSAPRSCGLLHSTSRDIGFRFPLPLRLHPPLLSSLLACSLSPKQTNKSSRRAFSKQPPTPLFHDDSSRVSWPFRGPAGGSPSPQTAPFSVWFGKCASALGPFYRVSSALCRGAPGFPPGFGSSPGLHPGVLGAGAGHGRGGGGGERVPLSPDTSHTAASRAHVGRLRVVGAETPGKRCLPGWPERRQRPWKGGRALRVSSPLWLLRCSSGLRSRPGHT